MVSTSKTTKPRSRTNSRGTRSSKSKTSSPKSRIRVRKPARPAARRSSDDAPNRSEFIRKNLLENPEITAKKLANLWKRSGFPGELSASLFSQVRARMREQSGGRRKVRRSASASRTRRTRPATSTGRGSGKNYLNIERSLDQLIFQAEGLGNRLLAEDLRQARRRVSQVLIQA